MAKPSRAKEPTVKSEDLPLAERVWRRAHELALERGGQSGFEMDDWLQAQDAVRSMEQQKKGHG